MIPSTETRLGSMMRAMTESILPALDPNNSLAQEQAGLLLGHLNALIEQQGKEADMNRQEQEELITLARLLIAVADGGELTQRAVNQVEQAISSDLTELSLAVEQLIVASDASESFKVAANQPILDFSAKQAARGRQWFSVMGF